MYPACDEYLSHTQGKPTLSTQDNHQTTDMSSTTQDTAASLQYTCNTCLVAFHRSDAQRDHMRKDWHHYNMKRRMASLPPVALETFNEKVLAAKTVSNEAAAKASYEKTCHTCSKAFYSENSYQNHVNSSKHKQREARLRKDGDSASVQSSAFSLGEPVTKSDETDISKVTENLKTATIDEQNEDDAETEEDVNKVEFSPGHCLFCKIESTDIHTNVDHMRKDHGMFIPEQKYLVDLDGLINYLFRKITENFECLYCHTMRNTAQAIQTHMRDKSHCMIAFDSEDEQVEIGQFYDFRGTYSEDEDESSPASGDAKATGDGEDQGWETESSASSVDEDDLDNYRNKPAAYEHDYELHLPSGKSVGHRSLAKYYRQNLHNYLSPSERAARQLAIENGEIEEDMGRVRTNHHRAITTRANGGTGMIGATEEQKETALTAERRERTRALRQENRYVARVQRANNFQKHFRDPLLQ
ncbi:Zinc finger U1-type [Penicillium soppii]|uniref:Zinc finger U1-type n=1 Tax=Penicillium soppii TaxID=69789 RepID=UPI0025485215|nr:Zinc finger U1-type [Penicillium soppii]KAJ5856434.1 Zinc finger U1-type [Penicillium soppii]